MGDGQVSAIPDNLINYGVQSVLLDSQIDRQATALGQALSAFISSAPDPKYIGAVPRLDKTVSDLAASARSTDGWVGRVGEAFKVVAQREVAFEERHMGETGLNAGTMPVTSTQSQIASYTAGMAASFQTDVQAYVAQQSYKQGQSDAQRLLNALNDGSGKTTDADIQAIVQQLKGHLNDPNYCAGYFAKLGPDMTLSTVQSLIPQGHGNFPTLPPGNPLQTFDEALASASHSSLLPGDFVTKVFPNFDLSKSGTSGQQQEQVNYRDTLDLSAMLLRYGTYSQAFLQQGLQTIVMPYMDPMGNGSIVIGDARYDPQAVTRNYFVLEALARNPTADAQILGSDYFNTRGYDTGKTNVQVLLEGYGQWDYQAGGGRTGSLALPDVLNAVGKDGNVADRMAVLQGIGAGDWTKLPDVARPAIANLLAQDIGNPAFLQHEKAASGAHATDLTWQERLFIAATTDHNGKVDATGYATLTQAVKGWLQTNPMPSGESIATGKSPGALVDWEHEYGTLVGLLNLGTIAGPFKSAADRQATLDGFNELWLDVTTFIPPAKLVDLVGGNALAKKLFSLTLLHVKSGLESGKLAPDFPIANDNSLQVWRKTSADARASLTTQAVLGDPDVMPAAVRAAYQKDPTGPAVENFITTLAQARSMNDLNVPPTDPRYNQLANIVLANEALQGEIDPEFKVSFHN
ncbi:MAG: hypothetical protein WAM30_00505 [Candidatus Dormiibacterota bacterium]